MLIILKISKEKDNVKEISIKVLAHFFFDDIINIKDLGPGNTQIDKKFCKNILINYIEYVTPKCTRLLYLATNTILL